jgi:periplasmic protein TonB
METEALIIRTWDDLVFRSRNKEYGAYLIRKAYSKRVVLGAGISVALLAGFLIFSGLAAKVTDIIAKPPLTTDGKYVEVLPEPKIEQRRKLQKVTPPVRSTDLTKPILVVTTPVEHVPETVTEPSATDESFEGADGGGITDGTETATQTLPVVIENKEPVTHAEIMPAYEGGMKEMMKFITKHIKYPAAPKKLGIEGTVYVTFVIQGDGKVSDVKVLRGIHQKCDEEAVRVISMLPGWSGGKQNGYPVAVKMVLPIKFSLSN